MCLKFPYQFLYPWHVFGEAADGLAVNNHGRLGHQPGALEALLGYARLLEVTLDEFNLV